MTGALFEQVFIICCAVLIIIVTALAAVGFIGIIIGFTQEIIADLKDNKRR